MYAYAEPSPFPPSFEGDPLAYLIGLFGDVVAAGLALAILLGMVFEARRNRHIGIQADDWHRARHFMVQSWLRHFTVLQVHRSFVIGILLFIIMRAGPDALWMLLWGEVSEPVIRALLRADMLLDGIALVPFFVAILCWVWSRQVVPQKLVDERQLQMPRLTLSLVAQNAKIVLIVLVIAAGVTVGKASA